MEREHSIPLEDGVIITEIVEGDGSTDPLLSVEMENVDADNCDVNLTWWECVQVAAHLLDRATEIRDEAIKIEEQA